MPTIETVKIGRKLKAARRSKFLTQQELASAAGISQKQLSKIENDEVDDPRFSTIRRLAAALEVDPSELLDD